MKSSLNESDYLVSLNTSITFFLRNIIVTESTVALRFLTSNHLNLYRVPCLDADTLMQHSLIIGADFLNTVEVNIKQGKQDGLLNTIDKGELPFDTYHVDYLGPLPSTKKSYRHIFVVIDTFTKFVWLYSTKLTSSTEIINCLKKQSVSFGNPRRIISSRGTAFTVGAFEDYCNQEAYSIFGLQPDFRGQTVK